MFRRRAFAVRPQNHHLPRARGTSREIRRRGDRMRKESPARWAPVATGARFVAAATAQRKSRDTRSASLALGRGRKRRILRIFRLTLGAGVTPAQGSVKPTVGFTFN